MRLLCNNKQVSTDKLDKAVWDDVCGLLRNPNLLRKEYEDRLASSDEPPAQCRKLAKQIEQSQRNVNRLIDVYSDGVISREEFDPRIERARTQLAQRRKALAQSQAVAAEHQALKESLQCMESFITQIEGGLDSADWNTRREILRTAIEHIEVEPDQIRITYRINFPFFLNREETSKSLHFRWRRTMMALTRLAGRS